MDKIIELTREERIIANTGLGIMIQLIEERNPIWLNLIQGHPEQFLLTFENITKLSKKFRVNDEDGII